METMVVKVEPRAEQCPAAAAAALVQQVPTQEQPLVVQVALELMLRLLG
jgi:hypothetical protein